MTQATRVEALLAAFAKTAGRRFDRRGQPILSADEQRTLEIAADMDRHDHFERLLPTVTELVRNLEALSGPTS